MGLKKIQLINAPLSQDYIESSRAGAYPPLNLLSLATYLKENNLKNEIEILDGELLSCDRIIKKLNADIVGISANILSYSTAIEIAKAAKENGSSVVLGGHYPTALPRKILKNRDFIDAVVIGDGEEALLQFVENKNLKTIKNLAFSKNGIITVNPTNNLVLDKLPRLDFSFINLEPYYRNFQKKYPNKPFNRPFAIYSSKGCLWRSTTGGCIYCGIQTKGLRIREPKYVWDEILHFMNLYDADFFWDVSDTITSNRKWLREFLHHKPSNKNPSFHLYGRVDQIDDETVDLLSRLNCYELFLGIESGDDGCLISSNKGFTTEKILNAIEKIEKKKIKIILSFLIGLPGESYKSVENTISIAKSILKITTIQEAFVSLLLPLPGSRVFDMILEHPEIGSKYKDIDNYSPEEIRKDWIENFTNISYEQAQKYRDTILSLFPFRSSFGKPKKHYEV